MEIWANIRTIVCRSTLKRLHDMIRTYCHMHCTDKYSQHSSIIWPVWLNGWVFVYELSDCGFESNCSHLNLRFRTCLELFKDKMVLRMTNFNILGVHWKIPLLGGSRKTNISRGLPKNGGWTVCCFKGGLARKRGVVFLRGGWYPNAHYVRI